MPIRRSLSILVLIVLIALPAAAGNILVEVSQDVLAVDQVCTLREAVINANADAAVWPDCAAGSGVDTIEFGPTGTINLTITNASLLGEDNAATGDLDIRSSMIIQGNPAGTTTIDAHDIDRHFHVNPENNIAGITLVINDIHLTNGFGHGGGGSIVTNNASVTLERVTITSCLGSQADGGAIISTGGVGTATLNLTNCTISGNTASHHAGAILVDGGVANITNTTITNNASGFSNLTGGIRALGTVNLRNTIVAGNGGVDLPNLDGTFTSLGYNIVGEFGTNPGNPNIVATVGDQLDVADATVNLGALANNGGTTPTHALGAGSIAIDKGHSSGSTTDQRGLTRPCDDAGIANATGGDGGDVGAFEVQTVCAGANASPDAVDDVATVSEDSGANPIDVLVNDTDPDLDTLTITAVTQGAHGSVANNGVSVSYTPNADFFGSDSFTYTIDDGHSATDTATVNVTVLNVQDAPNAADDNATVAEDSGANAIAVLANDSDVDGDTLVVSAVTHGAHGSVANNATSVSYTPNADFFGSDSFTYTISDGHGGSDTATVHVTVTNVNDAPVASADAYTIDQDTPLNVPAPGVLVNDTDVDGDGLTATNFTNPSHGSLSPSSNGGFQYQPNPGFAGIDTFTYTANDGTVNSNVATVTITVLDTQPPSITASVAQSLLWPPNHELINVGLAFSATDNVGVVSTQVEVFSDEDDVTPGGGDQSPDAKDIAAGTLRLRSERSGSGDGRVYLIRLTATDAASNTSHTCLTVVVPKSMSAADIASVNAQAAAAAAQCPPAGYFVVGDGPVNGPKQ